MSRAIVKTTPTPSRNFSRKVVKRAGPMEKFFFTNSTLVTQATIPNTYMSAAVRNSFNTFNVFGQSDYSQGASGRERIYIDRLDVNVNLQVVAGTSTVPFLCFGAAMLVRATSDDFINDVSSVDVAPFGTQGSVIGFQDLNPKVASFFARRRFTQTIPPADTFAGTDTDANLSAILQRSLPKHRMMKFTIRRKWLREPENLYLVFTHIKYAYNGTEPVTSAGNCVGWHETYCRYRRY